MNLKADILNLERNQQQNEKFEKTIKTTKRDLEILANINRDMPGNDLQHIENFNQICQLRLNQAEAEKRILDRKICQVQQKIISEFQQRLDNVIQRFIMKK